MSPASPSDLAERRKAMSSAGRWISTGRVVTTPTEAGYAVQSLWEYPGRVVKKIELPNAWRPEALASLARMNFTADSLFPRLDGVGRTMGLYLDRRANFHARVPRAVSLLAARLFAVGNEPRDPERRNCTGETAEPSAERSAETALGG